MQTLLKGNEQESQLLSKKEVEFIKLLVKDFKTEFEQVVNRPQFQSQSRNTTSGTEFAQHLG